VDYSLAIPAAEMLDTSTRALQQGTRLGDLLTAIHGRNAFYTRKLDAARLDVRALRFPGDLRRLPLTEKAELLADQAAHPPWGTALSEDLTRYTRYSQTSATTGRPLRWLDTNDSWQWMLECWKAVYRGARVDASDRILFAFSFGPFLGLWTAFDAACQIGAQAIPGGGMSSQQRLALIEEVRPTVVCCTPTYALRLAEVAAEEGRALTASGVRTLVVAGEPGGSIPDTRRRIEQSWGARVIDHHGLTETGPISFECQDAPGFLHLNETEFVCEVLSTDFAPAPDGQPGELVITNLGRTASPVVRYRTGDVVVRRQERCVCGRTLARLEGGIIGRTDDMVTVRGINIYPTAIEAVVRSFAEVTEFRTTIGHAGAMRTITLDVELSPAAVAAETVRQRLAYKLREVIGLNMDVRLAGRGTLPRFEMKARRFVVES
jgi:phenylacetate-CoA ligase